MSENAGDRAVEVSAPEAVAFGTVAALVPGRRGEILDAALTVFSEKGYASGSMRDIAAHVGVTEPALYRHFASKEALFLALVRAAAGHLRDRSCGVLEGIRPEGLRAGIVEALEDRRRAFASFGPVLRTLLAAAAHDEAVLAEVRSTLVPPLTAGLIAKVEELDRAYGLESDAASREARVRAFMALFLGTMATSFVFDDRPDEAIADAVVRMMGWEGKV